MMFSGFLKRSCCRNSKNLWSMNRGPLLVIDSLYTGDTFRGEQKIHENDEKRRSFWSWLRSTKDDNGDQLKKIQSQKWCEGTDEIILDPECKVAIVVGGAVDIGLSAADCLLYNGARAVILVDEDHRKGENAARNLCDFYGKNRARFLGCGAGSSCQFEGIFEETIARYKKVDVLFSNLDDRSNGDASQGCNLRNSNNQWSNTKTAIESGMRFMGLNNGGTGGIIINAASIVGFMGWPIDPTPVYRSKEPVVETTIDSAKIYPVEKTGVRIVALLKSNRSLADIGLPDFPKNDGKSNNEISRYCEPSAQSRIGKALVHVMARGKNGSTWLAEPAPCLRETPWLIHFPAGKEKTVDPQIYAQQNNSIIEQDSYCLVAPTNNCPASCRDICRKK